MGELPKERVKVKREGERKREQQFRELKREVPPKKFLRKKDWKLLKPCAGKNSNCI